MNEHGKKRKKSGTKRMKKYAKIGLSTTRVDEETYNYFSQIYKVMKGKFETEDERGLVANNAMEQSKGKEMILATDQFLSRVIEDLLPHVYDEHIESIITAFSDLRILSQNKYGSHVLQTLTKVCANRFRDNGKEVFGEFVNKISLMIFNNIEEFIYDMHANQIGRTCIKECCGSEGEAALYPDIVKDLVTRLLKWPQIKDLADDPLTSGFLQTLLEGLSNTSTKLTKEIIKRFLAEYYLCGIDEEENKKLDAIPEFFEYMPPTRLFETIVDVSKGKVRTKIYLNIFQGRLGTLSCGKSSFKAVEKLIASSHEVSELGLIVDELLSVFPGIVSAGHTSILLALAKACKRLNSREGDFLKALKVAFQVEHTCRGELVAKLLSLDIEGEINKVNLIGSLLLQELLYFKKPISVVESLLALDPKKLMEIFTSPQGSHIPDAFVKSNTIGEKSRERLIQTLRGHYKDLAKDKFGSRVIEALWSRATLKDKHIIIGELDRTVSTTMFGSIISEKFKLNLYLTNKNAWAAKEGNTSVKKMAK